MKAAAIRESIQEHQGDDRGIPKTLHPTPYALHPTPYTLHPTPYTLHPIPYTLHPTPHTPHPTPYTLHHRPYIVSMFRRSDYLIVRLSSPCSEHQIVL